MLHFFSPKPQYCGFPTSIIISIKKLVQAKKKKKEDISLLLSYFFRS